VLATEVSSPIGPGDRCSGLGDKGHATREGDAGSLATR
jgi:hypothetical protein